VLQPQAPIATERQTYNVDFLVSKRDGPSIRIAIELDGHEFHERTQTQAGRDKSRERAIVSAGLPLLRFTGSEVFNNPRGVIDEVVAYFDRSAA
jgi:very-short-patch-repair endonuclease